MARMFQSIVSGRRKAWLLMLPAALVCAACSPALNWRDTRFPATSFVALLPCEADHAQRSVPLGGVPTELTMAGCDAGGATFAVMLANAPATQANALLQGWRQATLANIHAQQEQSQAFQPRGGLALPESVRVRTAGNRADGRSVQMHAIWAARIAPDSGQSLLVHAVMYSDKPMPEAAETFFGGLRF